MTKTACNANVAAKNVPYFTPIQQPPAGTALIKCDEDIKEIPKLYQPIRIRDVVFPNRIWVSPMCQYSAQNGFITPWHMSHLGGILQRGPGHTMIEATAVVPNGRITPEDVGIWSDDHISGLSQLVTFAHSQSQKIGIQLAHAGRKASNIAPWIEGPPTATEAVGGWPDDVWAPSALAYEEAYPMPKALSTEAVKGLVKEFGKAAQRAVKAGFDTVEIHGAHGYLIDEFMRPASNKRTDEYGGSFENRVRLLLEVVDEVRGVIPDGMPLFVRVSATDWLEEATPDEPSWRSEDTVRLAPILFERGVDFLDVSSGGNHPKQQIKGGPAYQAFLARDVMRSIGAKGAYMDGKEAELFKFLSGFGAPPSSERPRRLIVGTVGAITTGSLAERLLNDGSADVISVGRHFLKNTYTVWEWAEELGGFNIKLPGQFAWGFKGRGKKTSDGKEDHAKGSEDKRCKV